MNAVATPSVCLAMLVKDEAAVIERCLDSVRNHIDTWVIVDTGSNDDTEKRVKAVLRDFPGEWISRPWQDFSSNRNELLEYCRNRADYLLCLDADETLKTTTSNPWQGLQLQAYSIEVKTPRCSYVPIRMFRDDADCRYSGVLAEILASVGEVSFLPNAAIIHHEDGVRWRDPARSKRDILMLEGALLETSQDPILNVALADRFAARGDLITALYYYRERAKMDGDKAETWYALYQVGRMLDELGYASSIVAEAYYKAYAFRPTKIEPLVRIARRCRREGNVATAAEIAQAAVETQLVDRSYYFEPQAYNHFRHIEYLWANLELNRYAEVVEMAERLCGVAALPLPVLTEIEDIRNRAIDRQALNPDLGSLTVRPKTGTGARNPIPVVTPFRQRRKLCIGMSTYDDYDGVYFSVQAIRLYHAEVLDQLEILVIDNNPTGPGADALKALDSVISNYRYVPQADAVGCIARNYIFGEANSDFVLVMDCHVFLAPGALKRLIEYFDANPLNSDLVQGPLVYDDLKTLSTHFEPDWKKGMYGVWQTDPRGLDPDAEPFDIPMQGCGVFACRKEAWPGFNTRFRGFGAEEAYIHEKFRQAGGRTLCLPFLRWMHRFNRPLGIPYSTRWSDRIRNYMIGWRELGLDLAPIKAHFSELIGATETEKIFTRVENEMQSPLFGFDGVYYCPRDNQSPPNNDTLHRFFKQLHITDRVINVGPVTENQRLMTYRSIIERAQRACLETVLVIEDIDEITEDAQSVLCNSMKAFEAGDADSFILSAKEADDRQRNSATVAIGFHRRLFERLIDQLPELSGSASEWLAANRSLESYLRAAP